MCSRRKISILPRPNKGVANSWGVEALKDKTILKNVQSLMRISRGVGCSYKKIPFRGGGMDILWNCTIVCQDI